MSLGPIVRCWVAAEYEADLRFYDRMYEVAQQHKPRFEHWSTNRLAVSLYDYERHEQLVIANKRCGCEAANPEELDSSVTRLAGIAGQVIDQLAHGPLKRMGVQLVVYVNVGLTFEELTEQLRPLCLPKNEMLEAMTSSKVTEIALHFDYERDGTTARLRAGPMNRDQGLEQVLNVGEHTKLFAPPDKGPALAQFYAAIPETFMYFEIEVFTEQEHGANEWSTFVADALAHSKGVLTGLRDFVMEQ